MQQRLCVDHGTVEGSPSHAELGAPARPANLKSAMPEPADDARPRLQSRMLRAALLLDAGLYLDAAVRWELGFGFVVRPAWLFAALGMARLESLVAAGDSRRQRSAGAKSVGRATCCIE